MKGQSRKESMIESAVNILVGYWVAVAATALVFPWFGIPVELTANLIISGFFTAISLARSYTLRRLFNSWYCYRHKRHEYVMNLLRENEFLRTERNRLSGLVQHRGEKGRFVSKKKRDWKVVGVESGKHVERTDE